jgi:ketosteroid isomerase-like protein
MAVWADDDEIVCVHPGGVRVVGAAAIGASFEALFANGGVPAQPEQVRRLLALGVAVHHLVEHLQRPAPPGQPAAPTEAWMLATNVYVNTAQGWRMVAHHASPGLAQQPPTDLEWPSTLH